MDSREPEPRHSSQDEHARTVGGIAHDLNNLLGSLLGNLQLGRMRLAQGQSAEKHLDRVERGAERAVELCRRLRTLGQPGAESKALLEFHALLQEALVLVEACLPSGTSLEIDLAQGDFHLQGHRSELQQALMNLVLNAAESHQGRAGRVRVRTASILREGRPHLILEVQDDGCGMTEEVRARILEPWFSTKGAGRGLGLNAMAAMLQHHGGFLDVQSTPGQGSTFCLGLPLEPEGTEKL